MKMLRTKDSFYLPNLFHVLIVKIKKKKDQEIAEGVYLDT